MAFLSCVGNGELHHATVRIVLVVERSEGDMGQDPEVAWTSSHHGPEQFIIFLDQLNSLLLCQFTTNKSTFSKWKIFTYLLIEKISPVRFPYSCNSSIFLVSQNYFKLLNVVTEETKTSNNHPIPTSLDMPP